MMKGKEKLARLNYKKKENQVMGGDHDGTDIIRAERELFKSLMVPYNDMIMIKVVHFAGKLCRRFVSCFGSFRH